MRKLDLVRAAALLAAGIVSTASHAADAQSDRCAGQSAAKHAPLLRHNAEPLPAELLPVARQAGAIRYLSGGIGIDSADAMRAHRNDYPVAITFLFSDCGVKQFTAGIQVLIETAGGEPLLEAVTEGPYLFLDLPAGSYRLDARSDLGAPQRRAFAVVAGKHLDLTVTWIAPD
jgi:hypothetical protein